VSAVEGASAPEPRFETRFRRQIAMAVDAVRIQSSGTFTFLGVRSRAGARGPAAVLPQRALRRRLCDAIADRLYAGFYMTGAVRTASATGPVPRSRRASEPVAPPWPDEDLVRNLSEANAGAGPWTPGWRLEDVDPRGDPIVSRRGLSLVAPASACRPGGGGAGDGGRDVPARHRQMEVRYPKELLGASPGFYVALGDTPMPENDAMLRVYWNLRPSGAAAFVRLVTSAFNHWRIPFELKVPHDPTGFARRDAGILYLPRDSYLPVLPSLRSMHEELLPHLRAGAPALAFPVARGVSVAEDPLGVDSFGTARCALLAEGIVRAHERRVRTPEARLGVVLEVFRTAGVDPERPYLNPDSSFEPVRWRPSAATPAPDDARLQAAVVR
jgi:hypothetical protein